MKVPKFFNVNVLTFTKTSLLGLLFCGLCFASQVGHADAAVSNWQKGASIQSRGDNDFGSDAFKQSLRDLKSQGANYVTLVIPYYQSNIHSTDIGRGWNTPTDSALAAGIDYAHSIGLAVSLKIHLESYDGQWRAYINPDDRAGWFNNYKNVLMQYANIAKAHNVEQFVIGTELISMSTATSNGGNTASWNSMIGSVRSVYSGKLTYSANWGGDFFTEETAHIDFWGSLDYIGISAYYPLSQGGGNDVNSLKGSWDYWNQNKIKPLSDRWGKPVLFTEVGYRSVSNAHNQPWNSWDGGAYDSQEQVNDYTALFSFWNDYSYMQGGSIWDWSSDVNAGGQGDVSYTPQHKPAEDVMKNWFQGGSTPPPPQSATFTAAGNPASQTAKTNDTPTVTVSVTNGSTQASNIIVDVEVYAPDGSRVLQKFFEGQNFNPNESKSYPISFTASADSGTYSVKAGVFNSSWSQNYFWGDKIAEVTIGSGSTLPPPPPTNTSINVWWPTDNAHLTGVQPFKAMLTDRDVSAYKMFWQVDGDRLNEMANVAADYPHKEAIVDLSGWNWKNAGSAYNITFLAQDLSGSLITNRTVPIFIP